MQTLFKVIEHERNQFKVYPEHDSIFRALSLVPMEKTKVVIIGQDPYPQPDIADGLAFSTQVPSYIPDTLKIVFKEIRRSCYPKEEHEDLFKSCDLTWWADQGVLLLNTALTVRHYDSGSHIQIWRPFLMKILAILNELKRPVCWMLWGTEAKAFRKLLNEVTTLFGGEKAILTGYHPIAESRGSGIFTGCDHFVTCNIFLEARYGKGQGIEWKTYPKGKQPFPADWLNFEPL